MDILYYSNYCKHSQLLLQTLGKINLEDKVSFICIDKRSVDPKSGQMYIFLNDGKRVIMPPNIHSVPAMLLVHKKYQVIYGDEILQHLEPEIDTQKQNAVQFNGEPVGFPLGLGSGGSNIVSEQFTFYNMSPEELSSKGRGGMRQMYNYVPASTETLHINTPPDTYRPNKISSDVTIDTLEQQRNNENGKIIPKNPLMGI